MPETFPVQERSRLLLFEHALVGGNYHVASLTLALRGVCPSRVAVGDEQKLFQLQGGHLEEGVGGGTGILDDFIDLLQIGHHEFAGWLLEK